MKSVKNRTIIRVIGECVVLVQNMSYIGFQYDARARDLMGLAFVANNELCIGILRQAFIFCDAATHAQWCRCLCGAKKIIKAFRKRDSTFHLS